MKKLLAFIMAVVMLVALVACGVDGGGQLQKPSDVSSGDETTKATVGGEDPQTQPQETETQETEPQQTQPQQDQEATVAETVLLDEKGIKITAKGLKDDIIFGPELKLLIENDSGEDLTFQVRDCSINGYMVDPMMSVDVVDGKKANDGMTFLESELEACGITSIADIEFRFHIFTTEDWEDFMDTEVIQIKTSIAETYEYTYDDSGDVAYEKDGVKVVVKGLDTKDSILGPGIVVYIENQSGQDITVQTRDVSVNGFMVDAMFSSDVIDGKHAVDSITFLSSELEENEIKTISDVELSFHIFDSESWDTIDDTEVVKITF